MQCDNTLVIYGEVKAVSVHAVKSYREVGVRLHSFLAL